MSGAIADSITLADLTAAHWESVRTIYLQGIATGNATFETDAPDWTRWNEAHCADCRMVGMRNGEVIGFAVLTPASRRHVYRGVAEVSVYIREDARGSGAGRMLLAALVACAEAAGYWTLQASVFPENEATIRLHTSLGFRVVGRRERIAQHHGRWRDTLILERRSRVVGI